MLFRTRGEVQHTQFIVSMPLQDCVLAFQSPLPEEAQAAARRLKYRDFLTVALIIKRTDLFPTVGSMCTTRR